MNRVFSGRVIAIIGALTCLVFSELTAASSNWPDGFDPNTAQWIVGEYESNGNVIVMKVIEDRPPQRVRELFEWLTVISWNYDGSARKGMPDPRINEQMVLLETTIDKLQERQLCMQVYTKTGDGLKELVYYIGDREEFMRAFNEVLADQPRYPLEIDFYEDPDWSDLKTVHQIYLGTE